MKRSLLLLGLLTVGLAVPAAAQATTGGFTVAPSAKIGGVPAYFTGVTAPTPTTGWIIGSVDRHWNPKTQWALLEQWNGTSWSRIGLPSLPPTADTTHLLSISSTTPTDVWAVGWSSTPPAGPGSLNHHQLVYRRTAAGWQRVTIRATNSGDIFNEVWSVSVASPTDVWALGWDMRTCGEDVLHYNGAHWSVAGSADTCDSFPHYPQITAVGASTAWATGRECGTPVGASNCGGEASCFGATCPAGSHLIAGWDAFFPASAGTASNLWALGQDGLETLLVEHWDGTAWQDETPPFADRSQIVTSGVVLPNGDLWTAGYQTQILNHPRTQILHETGSGWESLDGPNPSPLYDKLFAIAHVGGTATGMWAVGFDGNQLHGGASPIHHPLLLHHS
jgi:hypothetical protein